MKDKKVYLDYILKFKNLKHLKVTDKIEHDQVKTYEEFVQGLDALKELQILKFGIYIYKN